jgi:signal transduction histidine kinase
LRTPLRKRAATAKLEAQHNLALATAEQMANQAKSAFLANMSHELRSPLNAILGFSKLALQSPALPHETKGDLEIVAISGEHLYSLINQVLDLSKIEAGRTTLDEVNFDPIACWMSWPICSRYRLSEAYSSRSSADRTCRNICTRTRLNCAKC